MDPRREEAARLADGRHHTAAGRVVAKWRLLPEPDREHVRAVAPELADALAQLDRADADRALANVGRALFQP